MRFALNDDQRAIATGIRELLAGECTTDCVRAAWGSEGREAVSHLWAILGASGAFELAVPVAEGGLGGDTVMLAAVAEEAGRAAVPGPFIDTVALAAPLLFSQDDPLRHAVVRGEAIVACGIGRGELVPHGAIADAVILEGPRGVSVYECEDCDVEPIDTIDGSRGLARIRPRAEGRPLGASASGYAREMGVLMLAAELVGLSHWLLDRTVAYVREREQFGKPVGTFQAVQHHLADACTRLAFARPAVLRAAWGLATDDPQAARDVSIAKAVASDAAGLVVRHAIQCHGAIAYTVEYDLHLYAKRVWALQADRGAAAEHRGRVADLLGVPAGKA